MEDTDFPNFRLLNIFTNQLFKPKLRYNLFLEAFPDSNPSPRKTDIRRYFLNNEQILKILFTHLFQSDI